MSVCCFKFKSPASWCEQTFSRLSILNLGTNWASIRTANNLFPHLTRSLKYSQNMADQDLTKLKVRNCEFKLKFQKITSITKFVCLFWKVAELRELLKVKGLNSVGNKQELIERLQAAVSESSGELNEDDLLNVKATRRKYFNHDFWKLFLF